MIHASSMNVFICPRDWTHATSRFLPTHLVSLQDPGEAQDVLAGLRPAWIPRENHYLDFFLDYDFQFDPADDDLAPRREQIAALIDWLGPKSGPETENRFLVHCNAGLGRSTAVGYILWAMHLGPGAEEEAFQRMIASALETQLVPNTVIVSHADDLLGRRGALKKPLTRWNARVTWRRTLR